MRRNAVMTAVVIALIAAAIAVPSGASTPESSRITVPTKLGETRTVTWKGTISPGVNPTSSCPSPSSPSDEHTIKVRVPDGAYDSKRLFTRATFKIVWDNADNDEILTVLGPGDDEELGSSDGGSPEESVSATNIAAGTYRALACAFAGTTPQEYTGTLTLTVEEDVSLPSVPARGLKFSATVPADPQRDEAEPTIEIDKDGIIYTCGPSGASQQVDYAQVSTDGGDQFHLLGEGPRGQLSLGGGGDCAPTTAPVRNEQGNYTLAYAGLNALVTFSTATSPDNGRTIVPNATSNSVPGVDRQWTVFSDADTTFLNYNQIFPRAITVQRSDDGGLTYGAPEVVSPNPDFPGQIRSMRPRQNPRGDLPVVYYPWNQGTSVFLAVSLDEGETWNNCRVAKTPAPTTAGFVTADHDRQGNIYVVYTEEGEYHTYLTSISNAELVNCKGGTNPAGGAFKHNPGFSRSVQVDRDDVRTTVFPWLTAGGKPGRVAVAFYGTESDGNPNTGEFQASWDVYVNQSLDALGDRKSFSQVKATTHPFHYDSICLNGLGCELANPPGDRSLADFFAIDVSPESGKLSLVYNQGSKRPGEASGHVATPAVVTQIGGPSNLGGRLDRDDNRDVLRRRSRDPRGDAIADYSSFFDPPRSLKVAASDLRRVRVRPAPNGGFTVVMDVTNLSNSALTRALEDSRAQSLLWIFRYVDGFQSSAATARWNPIEGFSFGHNGYETTSVGCGSTGEKCLVYPGNTPIKGKVDRARDRIRLTVPRHLLVALAGSTGPGQRPKEVPAKPGSRIYDATAFTLANPVSPRQEVQSFLLPLDNAPSMDFRVPRAAD